MRPARAVSAPMHALALALLLAGPAPFAAAQVFQFNEVGAARGLLPYAAAVGQGAGVAAADLDDDGDVDLFVPNAEGVPDQLYVNQGDGTYLEEAAARGLASLENHRAGLWVDVDGDRDLDLLVAGDCHDEDQTCPPTTLRLHRQEADGTFTEVTRAAGLFEDLLVQPDTHVGGLAAGDLDRDGDVDLYTALWEGPAVAWLNDGAGVFSRWAAGAGTLEQDRNHWQPVLHDVDGDGWLDVVQAVDFTANVLWRNLGGAALVDVAPLYGVDNAWNDMGVALGDYDNDLDQDVAVTNGLVADRHNVLYRRTATHGPGPRFAEQSQAAGTWVGFWGWGVTWLDADLDGWLDQAATNGGSGLYPSDPSRFFRNTGAAGFDPAVGPTFDDVSTAVGFDDGEWGSALLSYDHDRDGDPDLVQACMNGPLRLLELEPPAGRHHLLVKPRSDGGNHRALGAVVQITVGGQHQSRLITAGTSFLGQEPAEALFGLGAATVVDRVCVTFPDGTMSCAYDVPADQTITIWRRPPPVRVQVLKKPAP